MSALSRRQFLIGAGATGGVVVVGGGAYGATHQSQVRRFLHGRGVIGGPDQAIPNVAADATFSTFESKFARRTIGYGIYEPPNRPEAVLYCLHGRGGNHRDPFDDLGVHKFAAAAGLAWVVAAVDGFESFWHRRADGTDTQMMVLNELMPIVGVSAPSARALLIGWSMGGYGALLMAEQHPDSFAAVVASSPSVWRTAGESAAGAFDDAQDFARNDVLALADTLRGDRLRIDCGDDDAFAGVSRDLVRRVAGSSGGVRAGYHESPTWRSFLPDQLEFLRTRV